MPPCTAPQAVPPIRPHGPLPPVRGGAPRGRRGRAPSWAPCSWARTRRAASRRTRPDSTCSAGPRPPASAERRARAARDALQPQAFAPPGRARPQRGYTIAENWARVARVLTCCPWSGRDRARREMAGPFRTRAEIRSIYIGKDHIPRLNLKFLDGEAPDRLIAGDRATRLTRARRSRCATSPSTPATPSATGARWRSGLRAEPHRGRRRGVRAATDPR
jgi:hypothetical protein